MAEDRLTKFDLWTVAYKNISCSSKLCNEIFSSQLTMMLLTIMIYFIVELYSIVVAIQDDPSMSVLFFRSFAMVIFGTIIFLVSRVGQRVQNSSIKLKRTLCELYIHSHKSERQSKLTKDLLQCCCTHPVRMHMIGYVDVNMSMLPSCIAFVTTNTVILLQFNNVI